LRVGQTATQDVSLEIGQVAGRKLGGQKSAADAFEKSRRLRAMTLLPNITN
jgi:hypothetical protein